MKNKIVLLTPGEFFISKTAIIKSVLGTCVAICFYDNTKLLGLMYHGKYSLNPDKDTTNSNIDHSLPKCIITLREQLKCKHLKATIVGGSYNNEDEKNISQENIHTTVKILETDRISIDKILQGGSDKLIEVLFDTSNGDIHISFKK